MPRVTEEHRAARRDRITDAAIRAFAERGFQHTSMADIMSEAQVSAGGVYGHFASKREIAVEVATRVLGARRADIEAARAADPVPEPIDLVMAVLRSMRMEMHDSRLVVQLWAEASVDDEMRAIVSAAFATYLRHSLTGYFGGWAQQARHLSAGAAADWAELVVPGVIGMIQGYIVQSALLDDFDGERYLASLAQLLPHH